jgi:hypothetical protein
MNHEQGRTMKANETKRKATALPVLCMVVMPLLVWLWSPAAVEAAEFGMKVGVQRLENQGNNFRFRMGLYYGMDLGKNFSLQPELYLSQYQYNYGGLVYGNTASAGKDIRFFDKLRYLEAPVLLKYRVPLSGDLRPVVMAGVYGALRLSDRQPALEDPQLSSFWWAEFETPLIREYPPLEAGLVAGLGIEHGSGKTRMVFDVRFNIGLTRLVRINSASFENSVGEEISYKYSQRNHSLIFTVGLGF